MNRPTTIFAAPLQGYTDAEWRKAHNAVYGPLGGEARRYFTPFIRVEGSCVRARDIRALAASVSDMPGKISAQIIFRNMKEFRLLADAVEAAGCKDIDLNLGCPFPMQTGKGRGAAALENDTLLAEATDEMKARCDIRWSAKMRLGMSDPTAWKNVAATIASMPLEWVTVHPRVAAQGYKGDLHDEEVNEVIAMIGHPVIYNGDLTEAGDITAIEDRFPALAGVMAGRGLLSRPSLIAEYRADEKWDHSQRMALIRQMHDIVLKSYMASIEGGEHQVISKMIAFWEYLEAEIGHKAFKAIRKSKKLADYTRVVAATI